MLWIALNAFFICKKVFEKMPSQKRISQDKLPGNELRDEAADLLSGRFGKPKTEYREDGKKADIYFEYKEFSQKVRLYVEGKDLGRNLGRDDCKIIVADYMGIIEKNSPATLLTVSRRGLTADAQKYVDDEIAYLRHQSLLELEASLIDFEYYLEHLVEQRGTTGIANYYINSGYHVRQSDNQTKLSESLTREAAESAFEAVNRYIDSDAYRAPLAVLGGYGSGKTSLSVQIAGTLAERALQDSNARIPILIRLGNITTSSSIQGLLGGYFTSEFEVAGFSFKNFMLLNKKGRLVIILDGFDEMKHAMSFADFRSQVKSFLSLHCRKSKILLLGRPSAFLTDEEERFILRGEKRSQNQWARLPDWPRFTEIELDSFTPDERTEFIKRYLEYRSENSELFDIPLDGAFAAQRAISVDQIASREQELFSKPVHAKILTDLAVDPNFDLEHFSKSFSKWNLYKEFIESIYDREVQKSVRRDISVQARIRFIREIAFWLWTRRGAGVSFSLEDLPSFPELDILPELEDDDEVEKFQREYLAGSILEKKDGDHFYFGHRSFAEYLVADRMLSEIPSSATHSDYSLAFGDGVAAFVAEAGRDDEVRQWAHSLGDARGNIDLRYIQFIAERFGGLPGLVDQLSPGSFWHDALSPFSKDFLHTDKNYSVVIKQLFDTNPTVFSWLYCWLTKDGPYKWREERFCDENGYQFEYRIARALINSFFKGVKRTNKNFSTTAEYVGFRRICNASIEIYNFEYENEMQFRHQDLFEACRRELERSGIVIEQSESLAVPSMNLNVTAVVEGLSHPARGHFEAFAKFGGRFSNVTEVAKIPRRKQANPADAQRNLGASGKPKRSKGGRRH